MFVQVLKLMFTQPSKLNKKLINFKQGISLSITWRYWLNEYHILKSNPVNIRLEDVFCLCLQKISSRHLQDVLIKTNIFALVISPQNVLRRLDKDQYIHLGHTRSRRLQDVFMVSSTFSSRHLQDVLKTFWISLKGVFKISSRRLTKTSCKYLFETSSRRSQSLSSS